MTTNKSPIRQEAYPTFEICQKTSHSNDRPQVQRSKAHKELCVQQTKVESSLHAKVACSNNVYSSW